MSQYIYIGSTEIERQNNLFKIGKTKQPIEKRIKQYQTGRSDLTKFILLDYFPCNDCAYIEYLLKIKLEKFQHKNEVYNIDYNKLKNIIEETIELEDISENEITEDESCSSDNDTDSDYIPDSESENIMEINKQKVKKELLFEKDHLESIVDYLFNRIDSDLNLYFKTKRNKFYYKTNILKNINELEFITKDIKRNILDIFKINTLDYYNNLKEYNKEFYNEMEKNKMEIEEKNKIRKIKKNSIINRLIILLISFFAICLYWFIFYYL